MSAIESINFYLFDPNLNTEKSIQTTISAPTQFKGLKYRFTFSYNSVLKIFLGFLGSHLFYQHFYYLVGISFTPKNAKPFLINPLI